MDTACRYGGEEFTIILPETDGEKAFTVAERIRSEIENEKFSPEPEAGVSKTISIGLTQFHPGERVSKLVERADKAMYMSKQKGRNKITTFYK